MKVSIIIIGYNGKRYLKNCLTSVFDQNTQDAYEVIYADNASVDGSAVFVKTEFPSVKVVSITHNLGYYETFNYIAKNYAKSPYLIALPQDTIVHQCWLSELIRAADSLEEIKICLVNSVNPPYPDFQKKERQNWIDWVYLMSTSRFGFTRPKRWAFSPKYVNVLAYSGVSALIKRDTLTLTEDYFDSSLSHFLGDVEIGVRINVLGGKVILVPTAIVYHIEDNKSWTDLNLLLRSLEGARDTFVVYYKNMFTLEFLAFLPFLLIGTPLKITALRINPYVKTLLAFIAILMTPIAFFLALFRLPQFHQKREQILSQRHNGRFWLFQTILKGDLM